MAISEKTKEYQRAYREANKEKLKENNKAYQETNKIGRASCRERV